MSKEWTVSNEGTSSPVSLAQTPLSSQVTRRRMLHLFATGGAMLVGGAALSACGGSSASVNVTLYSATYPFSPMPTKQDQAKNPSLKAYAQSLQRWFDKNPGVTIKSSSTNIWDQQQLTTAISAGTAPSWVPGNVVGGWAYDNVLAAFARGMVADVTQLIDQYQVNKKIASYVQPLWSRWKVNGKYYGVPQAFHAGYGVYYRRDLLRDAGVEEPKLTWTWDDLHTVAKALTKDKRTGAAFNWYGITRILSANQMDLLTTLPSPQNSWPWRIDYNSRSDDWTRLVSFYRNMLLNEKVILSNPNPSYGDPDVAKVFAREDAAMFMADTNFFTRPASDDLSIVQLANRLKKPIDEVAGFLPIPYGTYGTFNDTQPYLSVVSFNPRLGRDQTALDKAFGLYSYMQFDQGYIDQQVATYQQTKDPQQVYSTVTPVNGLLKIEGVPVSAGDAWGKHYMQTIEQTLKIPLIPQRSWYLPPEQNAQPTSDAQADAQTALSFSQRNVADILTHEQDVLNQQLAGLSSSIPKDAFLKGSKEYYQAVAAFWKKQAPQFYSEIFSPWYQQKIQPVLHV